MYPLVTIGIPTYNRANSYLRQALESAVKQTYPNIEIVVSDNCSTDDTETLVKYFEDPRIRYFKQTENIGAYKNFNFCLHQAHGKYFLILSDDDLVDHDFIDVCMKSANYSTDIGIIRTGTRVIDDKGIVLAKRTNEVVGLSTEQFFRGWFASKTAFYPCSTLFNTKQLKEIGGFHPENNLFHDSFVLVKLAAKFGRVDVEDIKASFRKHQGEITFAVKVKDWSKDSLLLLDEMCNLVSKKYRVTIRKEGMKFFACLNYNRSKAIKTPIIRLGTYLMVYWKFDCVYSPIKYLIYPCIVRRIQFIKKLIT